MRSSSSSCPRLLPQTATPFLSAGSRRAATSLSISAAMASSDDPGPNTAAAPTARSSAASDSGMVPPTTTAASTPLARAASMTSRVRWTWAPDRMPMPMTSASQGGAPLGLPALRLRIGTEVGDLLRLVNAEGVDADDCPLAPVDLPLVLQGELVLLLHHPAAAGGLDHAALLVDLLEQRPGP